jgi:hypothetical protein
MLRFTAIGCVHSEGPRILDLTSQKRMRASVGVTSSPAPRPQLARFPFQMDGDPDEKTDFIVPRGRLAGPCSGRARR